MDESVLKKLEEQEKKINAIYISVEKTRKYIFWSFILSLVLFLLPLVGIIFAIPFFLKSLSTSYGL
jgi:type IV secretory pathway component VirB8